MKDHSWDNSWYGFFSLDGNGFPSIHDFIDDSWEISDFDQVLSYLERSKNILQSVSLPTKCILCDEYKGDPGSYYYDGVWLWPERLKHYISSHNVVLSGAFLAHIRHQSYEPIELGDFDPSSLPWPTLLT